MKGSILAFAVCSKVSAVAVVGKGAVCDGFTFEAGD